MDSNIIQVIILGVIQGVTEFLPISSSGHLVIVQNLMGIKEDNLLYAVILHAGTLASVIVYYFKDLLALLNRENRKTILLLIVGTLPVVVFGLLVKPLLEKHFGSLWLVGAGLMCTAVLLLFLHKPQPGERRIVDMRLSEALTIGLMQCLAILPGISRSGTTISIGTRLGLMQESAAKFSFFLSIPAIAGAIILQGIDLLNQPHTSVAHAAPSWIPVIVGFTVAFIVGYFSLVVLIHTLRHRTFSYFGYYCGSLSLIIIALQITN